MKKQHIVRLCRAGVFAALYVVLTLPFVTVTISEIQFRPSEALTMLPLLFPEAIPALFVGCMIANWVAGGAILDIFLGAVVTLVAAVCTYFAGKLLRNFKLSLFVGGLFPVLLNALILPGIWRIAYGQQEFGYWLNVAFLLASQSLVVYVLGVPLTLAAKAYLKHAQLHTATATSDASGNTSVQTDSTREAQTDPADSDGEKSE